MTIEELEIIVTAKVEEAVKQFKKIAPEIKKAVRQAQESFENMDTKGMKNKVQQAVVEVKKQLRIMKNASKDSKISILVTNKEAQKQIGEIVKSLRSLKKQTEQRYKFWRI